MAAVGMARLYTIPSFRAPRGNTFAPNQYSRVRIMFPFNHGTAIPVPHRADGSWQSSVLRYRYSPTAASALLTGG
jgi:hypothetical protein